MIWAFVCFTLCILRVHGFEGQPHHTTAFIAAPGTLWAVPSYSYQTADHFWNRQGKTLCAYNHFRKHAYGFYAEYAINPCNSISLNSQYQQIRETLNGKKQGLSALEAGWKFLFHKNCNSSSTAELVAIVPVSRERRMIQSGKPGAQISLLHSHWFRCCRLKGWVDLMVGYRRREGPRTDQLRSACALNFLPLANLRVTGLTQFYWGYFESLRPVCKHKHSAHALCTFQLEGAFGICPHIYAVLGFFKDLCGRHTFNRKGVLSGVWIDY